LISAVAKVLPSKLFSTGGDELNTNCYAKDPQTQADLNDSGRTLEQALNTFTQAIHGAIIAEGKTPVVWEGLSHQHQQPCYYLLNKCMACSQRWSWTTV
jgi:hexosaminidase